MKENIFNGHYNDPFDRDPLAEENIDNYAKEVQDIATNDKLKESYNKYFRKRRNGVEELEDDENFKYQHDPRRHMRKVNIGTEPWNYDQSFIWPDYEAESFENDLEQFRKRPESNTGYLNKKLNQIMQTRWGKEQADKCINNTLFKNRIKKESIQKRFQKSLKEQTKKAKLMEDAWLEKEEGVLEILVNGNWESVGIDKTKKSGWSTSVPGTVFTNKLRAESSGLFKRLEAAGYSEEDNTLRFNSEN